MRIPFIHKPDTEQLQAEFFAELDQLLFTASKAASADVQAGQERFGQGMDWTPSEYGDYLATSEVNYAAINVRAQTLGRLPLVLHTQVPDGTLDAVPPDHPAQRLIDRPNDFTTRTQLVRAIETNLRTWGKAYISNEIIDGRTTLWAIRPDRLVVIPSKQPPYIAGYRYEGQHGENKPYTTDEITPFTYYNPMEQRSAIAPIAPLRLTLDMGLAALTFNRAALRNGGVPPLVFHTQANLTNQQITDFYERWDKRFGGPSNANRPALVSGVMQALQVAFSAREMEWSEALRWLVEAVSRVHGVPRPMIGDMEEATLANVDSLWQIFYEMTVIPEADFIADTITQDLLPKIGWPNLVARFDISNIEALQEREEQRIEREKTYLELGVQTINEIRKLRGLDTVPWGADPDGPAKRRSLRTIDREMDSEESTQLDGELALFPESARRNGVHP
jgi:HK97 family phage portal protein